MSRSYKKVVSHGICVGRNTEFYRERNRNTRTKNRQMLRNLLANMPIEDIEEVIHNFKNKENRSYDPWCSPTDGKCVAFSLDSYLGSDYRHSYVGLSERQAMEENKRWYEKCKRK